MNKLLQMQRCKLDRTVRALEQRAMRLEQRINRFRISFFVFLFLIETIVNIASGYVEFLFDPTYYLAFGFLIILTLIVNLRTSRAIAAERYYAFGPWLSVTGELALLGFFGRSMVHGHLPVPVPMTEALVIFSFIIVLLNLLGAMRANKPLIVYQSIVATALVLGLFLSLPQRSVFVIYLPAFVFVSGIFSLWIADTVMESYIANDSANASNTELKNANEEVKQQNEEIIAQRDQIEQQHKQVLRQHKSITDSIRYAYRIQQAIFPDPADMRQMLPEHFILNKPRDIVSGDFYWLESYKHKRFVAVADSTGHGVPGAFMSMLGSNMLSDIVGNYIANDQSDKLCPATLLNELRDRMKRSLHQTGKNFEMKDGMDVALVLIDTQTHTLQFAGANNPLIIVRGQEVLHFKGDRMPIGIHRHERPFAFEEIALQPGDMLYLFSDGYIDQFGGPHGDKMLIKHFKELLLEVAQLPVNEQESALDLRFDAWRGRFDQVDDVLVMGIRYPHPGRA